MYTAIPKLIEKIHFDPKHPENQYKNYQKEPYKNQNRRQMAITG